MRAAILFVLVLLTAASCRQGPDYTCVCTDRGGTYGDQQYTIKAEEHGVAANECQKYAVSLNSGGGEYSCNLH